MKAVLHRDELYGVTLVAKRMGVSRQAVYNMIARGQLRAVKLPNGQIRVPGAHLIAVLRTYVPPQMAKPARKK